MPELPEVDSVRRQMTEQLDLPQTLKKLTFSSKQLRFPVQKKQFVKILEGRELREIRRHGKYLVLEWEHGILVSHLGMTGHWRIEKKSTEKNHDHLIFTFGDRVLTYNDPRRFGFILWQSKLDLQALNLGPDALQWELGDEFFKEMKKKSAPIKATILDQRVVAGIGNIYASEILFFAGIKPLRSTKKVSKADWEKIRQETLRVLQASIAAGGSTIDNYKTPDGNPGGFQKQLSVYGREKEKCRVCGSAILLGTLGGRSTYWCKQCQK